MARDALRDRTEGVTAPPTPGIGTMVWRACRLKCCVCGQGRLFQHWTKIVERCPRCGYLFERAEGQYIGAVGMNTVITFGLLLVTLVVGFVTTAPHTPAVTLSLVGLGVAVVFPVIFYPFSKTTWTAIDLAMTPLEPGEAPTLSAQLAAEAAEAAAPRAARNGTHP